MTIKEKNKKQIQEMVEMSGYNNTLRLLLEIAQDKSIDSKNWNVENKELWGHFAKIVEEASRKIEDAGYGSQE